MGLAVLVAMTIFPRRERRLPLPMSEACHVSSRFDAQSTAAEGQSRGLPTKIYDSELRSVRKMGC